MTPKGYATTSGIIFLLVALPRLLRLIVPWEFRVVGWDVPSWVGAFVIECCCLARISF